MTIEKIIININKYIDEERIKNNIECKSFLVVCKGVSLASNTFKAMKQYDIAVSIVKQDRMPVPLYYAVKTVNSTVIKSEDVYDELTGDIIIDFAKSLASGEFERVINGTYKRIVNETD